MAARFTERQALIALNMTQGMGAVTAKNLIEFFGSAAGIFEAGPAQKALPFCNIVFIDGEAMKARLGGYLEALMAQDAAAVGGALPGDDFYYVK